MFSNLKAKAFVYEIQYLPIYIYFTSHGLKLCEGGPGGEGLTKILPTMLSPKTSSRVFERSQQQSENPKKGALLLNSPSDKGGFEIMNIIIAVRLAERSALSFPSSLFFSWPI